MELKEATPNDYEALIDFWNINAGWDIIDLKIWEQRFINAPKVPSTVLFIEKDQNILAMLIFIFMDITLGDKIVTGCRPFASVVNKSVRGLSGIKYMAQILNFGYKSMKKKGVDILWMLPNPRWRHFAKLFNIDWEYFPLYKFNITEEIDAGLLTDKIVKIIDFDHHEIEGLWEKVQAQKIISIVRNQKVLKWKNSHRDYKLIGVFGEGSLVGVASFLEKLEEKQIQICDVLVDEFKNQEFVLSKVVELLKKKYGANLKVEKVVILVTKQFDKALINIGFVNDDYKFVFAFKRLNMEISKEKLSYSNWYLSAND